VAVVFEPHAGVHEHERVGGFDQEAVTDDLRTGPAALAADDLPAIRAKRPGAEVMDSQGSAYL
jgi:hypothetical protein